MMAVIFTSATMVLVSVGLLVALILTQRTHADAQAQWALERRELLNRIQAPQHIPVAPQHTFEIPDGPPDEFGLVGTIRNDPEMYLGVEEPSGGD